MRRFVRAAWRSERGRFVRASTTAGWRFFSRANERVGLAFALLAFVGLGYASVSLGLSWAGAFVLAVAYLLIFGEGAFRLWRDATVSAPATLRDQFRELLRRARTDEKYIDSPAVKKAGNPGWLIAYQKASVVLADTYALVQQELPEYLSLIDSGERTRSGWQEGRGPVMTASEDEMRSALAKAISGLEEILRSPSL